MKLKRIAPRRAANVSLPIDDLAEARALGVNISRACAVGLATEIKRVRESKWIAEHRDKFDAWNAWVEEHGLPLADYRQF